MPKQQEAQLTLTKVAADTYQVSTHNFQMFIFPGTDSNPSKMRIVMELKEGKTPPDASGPAAGSVFGQIDGQIDDKGIYFPVFKNIAVQINNLQKTSADAEMIVEFELTGATIPPIAGE